MNNLTTDELIDLAETGEEIDLNIDTLPLAKNFATKNAQWRHPTKKDIDLTQAEDIDL